MHYTTRSRIVYHDQKDIGPSHEPWGIAAFKVNHSTAALLLLHASFVVCQLCKNRTSVNGSEEVLRSVVYSISQ